MADADAERKAKAARAKALLAQLEEVRGKVVSTQEEKVELVAAVESWETKSKGWEKSRAELENQLEEGKRAGTRIATLESDVARLKKVEAQHETLEKEHRGLQAELEQSQKALQAHEQTIADLQAKAPAELDSAKTNGHATAGTDVESAVRAAHDLALSQREEKIRSLETELHASSSRVHALQRQLSDLQLAYAQSQAQSQSHSHLPPSISRPSSASHAKSYFLSPAEDDGLPNRPSPLRDNRSVDAALPASVRHKRQVSLSALKARMGIDAKSAPKRSPGLGNGFSSLQVLTEEVGARNRGDKQFGDEIMFCCPACEGDLITL
uniref:SMC prok B n=1 Tax=Tremella fuciformis TaxID=64657 RepID=D5KY54_9TREE|nr:SMC prok B [Tremella fuciformis]